MSQWYNNFLKSNEWRTFRAKILRAHPRCSLCGRPARELHHVRYPKNIWKINKRDIMPLCRTCHEYTHKAIDEGILPHPRKVDPNKRKKVKGKMMSRISAWSQKSPRYGTGVRKHHFKRKKKRTMEQILTDKNHLAAQKTAVLDLLLSGGGDDDGLGFI